MYVKIFNRLLDSSIWVEPTATRVVWIALLASMDEDGFVALASVRNVAQRAIVSFEEARAAIATLEAPDPDSSDPANDGRRIERVPGGWIVLNAAKFRALATREHVKEQTRQRVAKHRARRKDNAVTPLKSDVTRSQPSNAVRNAPVTPSEAEAEADAETEGEEEAEIGSYVEVRDPAREKTNGEPEVEDLLDDAAVIAGQRQPVHSAAEVDRNGGPFSGCWCRACVPGV